MREGEEEGEQRRREPRVGEHPVDLPQPEVISSCSSVELRDRGAVADPVAELGERELEVEHEVRVAQAQRQLRELEVVEVRLAREVVAPLAVAGLRRLYRLVDEPRAPATCARARRTARRPRAAAGAATATSAASSSKRRRRAPVAPLQPPLRLVEVGLRLIDQRRDLGAAAPSFISSRISVEIASSSSSISSWSSSPSGPSTCSKCSR